MDATPVTLGQEAAAWAGLLDRALARSRADLDALGELPLGGTAVGTGINAPAGFAAAVIDALADETGLPLRPSANPMVHQGGQGALAEASAGLRGIAVALTKIANDIRLLASGPSAGLGRAAAARAAGGSSIMPGKVNPVLCESVNQVAARVFGNDATVALRRVAGDPRAEHVPAGDGRRAARVGHAARQRLPGLRRASASPASRPTRSGAAATPSGRRRSPRRSTRSSATPRPPSSCTGRRPSAARSSTSWSRPACSTTTRPGGSSTRCASPTGTQYPSAVAVAGRPCRRRRAWSASSRPLAPKRNVSGVGPAGAHDLVGQVEVDAGVGERADPTGGLEADGRPDTRSPRGRSPPPRASPTPPSCRSTS